MDDRLERAQVLSAVHRNDEAAKLLVELIADEPEYAYAYILLCQIRIEQNMPRQAVRGARIAVSLAPDYALSHFVLSRALHAIATVDEDGRRLLIQAFQAAKRAVELAPNDPDMLAQAGDVLRCMGSWRRAINAVNRGLAIDPQHTRCLNVRSLAMLDCPESEGSSEATTAALEESPNDPTAHASRGCYLLGRRQPRQALTHLREAIRLNPFDRWARRWFIEALTCQWRWYCVVSEPARRLVRTVHPEFITCGAAFIAIFPFCFAQTDAIAQIGFVPALILYIILFVPILYFTAMPAAASLCLSHSAAGRNLFTDAQRLRLSIVAFLPTFIAWGGFHYMLEPSTPACILAPASLVGPTILTFSVTHRILRWVAFGAFFMAAAAVANRVAFPSPSGTAAMQYLVGVAWTCVIASLVAGICYMVCVDSRE